MSLAGLVLTIRMKQNRNTSEPVFSNRSRQLFWTFWPSILVDEYIASLENICNDHC